MKSMPISMIVLKTSEDPRIYLQFPGTVTNMAATAYPRTSPKAIFNW